VDGQHGSVGDRFVDHEVGAGPLFRLFAAIVLASTLGLILLTLSRRDVNPQPFHSDDADVRGGPEEVQHIGLRGQTINGDEGWEIRAIHAGEGQAFAAYPCRWKKRHFDTLDVDVTPEFVLERFGELTFDGTGQAIHTDRCGEDDQHSGRNKNPRPQPALASYVIHSGG